MGAHGLVDTKEEVAGVDSESAAKQSSADK